MANDITNELTFAQCSKERCREILEAIQRDDIGFGSINFHKIIPQPSFRTDKECLDWRIKNWDTKWEAYGYRDGIQYDEEKNQIRFLTANRSARKLIIALSRQYPDVLFELRYADDNFGFNVGEISICAGEDFDGRIPKENTYEAQELAADIMGKKLAFDIESASGYVRKIDANLYEYCEFESVAMLIAAKYGGYNKDPRATILKKRTFCQECGERITRDIQSARYHKWYCKGCLETALREERFYERILSALNAVIAHPELLDEVEPKDTYESDFDITRKSSELNHMLNNTHVDFEQTFEDILNLAALKYEHCELDITEELTATIKQDFLEREILEDISTELLDRTVSHVTLDKSGKVAVHFINGAVVRVEGEK